MPAGCVALGQDRAAAEHRDVDEHRLPGRGDQAQIGYVAAAAVVLAGGTVPGHHHGQRLAADMATSRRSIRLVAAGSSTSEAKAGSLARSAAAVGASQTCTAASGVSVTGGGTQPTRPSASRAGQEPEPRYLHGSCHRRVQPLVETFCLAFRPPASSLMMPRIRCSSATVHWRRSSITVMVRIRLARRSWARKKLDRVELAHQMIDQAREIGLGRDLADRRRDRHGRVAGVLAEPGVAEQEHGLGDVQRGEAGIDRIGDQRVGQQQLVVGEAGALGPEHDPDPPALGQGRRARWPRRPRR